MRTLYFRDLLFKGYIVFLPCMFLCGVVSKITSSGGLRWPSEKIRILRVVMLKGGVDTKSQPWCILPKINGCPRKGNHFLKGKYIHHFWGAMLVLWEAIPGICELHKPLRHHPFFGTMNICLRIVLCFSDDWMFLCKLNSITDVSYMRRTTLLLRRQLFRGYVKLWECRSFFFWWEDLLGGITMMLSLPQAFHG